MGQSQGLGRISPEAAIVRLCNLRNRCQAGMNTVDKKKWPDNQKVLAKLELEYEVAALDLAIACLSRPNVVSLPGADPASFGGA